MFIFMFVFMFIYVHIAGKTSKYEDIRQAIEESEKTEFDKSVRSGEYIYMYVNVYIYVSVYVCQLYIHERHKYRSVNTMFLKVI